MVQTSRASTARRRAGFTLLEVMLASSVLFVTMMAAVSSQLVSLSLVRTAREQNTAIAELSTAMEELLAEPIDSLPAADGYPEAVSIVAFEDRSLRDERIVPDYPNHAGGPVPEVLEIVLRLTYTDWAGRPAEMRLASMKAR